MTHFCIKALGEVLAAQPFLNGILTFGKVPYPLLSSFRGRLSM